MAEPSLAAAAPAASAESAPALIARCRNSVSAAERVLGAAKTGVRASIDGRRRARRRPARRPRPRLARDLRRSAAPDARLGRAASTTKAASARWSSCCSPPRFGEYLAQIAGGIPMSQVEIVRPDALGVPRADVRRFEDAVADLVDAGGSDEPSRRASPS